MQQPRIMVVDDDDLVLNILRRVLEAEKYSVVTASSAAEALSLLPTEDFAAVFCDMWMPGLTGKEFYLRVREEFPQYAHRFVFLTGDVSSEATWEFIDERRLPYLLKPLNLPQLRRLLAEVVGEPPAEPPPPTPDEAGAEKRQFRRIPVKARVKVQKKKWATGSPEITFTGNVSKEGLFFLSERSYRVGTDLVVWFPYTGSSSDTEQDGYIVRVVPQPDGTQGVAVALGVAAERARQAPPAVDDRQRHNIVAASARPGTEPLSNELEELKELRDRMNSERQEGRRLAEELADLRGTYDRVTSERDRLISEAQRLSEQFSQVKSTRETTHEKVRELTRQIRDLTGKLAENESFRYKATHDTLTGLWNRAALFEILQRELQRAKREGTTVGIVIADLDHFKRINDTCGHLAGDMVLQEAAQRISAAIRDYDSVGRYGGEEFVLVLPGCDLEAAAAQAERVRSLLSRDPIDTGEATVAVTASFGVAATDDPALMEQALHAADMALYRAKNGGRDRVEVDGRPSGPTNPTAAAPEETARTQA